MTVAEFRKEGPDFLGGWWETSDWASKMDLLHEAWGNRELADLEPATLEWHLQKVRRERGWLFDLYLRGNGQWRVEVWESLGTSSFYTTATGDSLLPTVLRALVEHLVFREG